MRRLGSCVAATAALVMAVPFGAAPAAAQAAPTSASVSMKSFAFNPTSVTVATGGTVTWTYDETPTDLGCESPIFQTVPGVNCPGHSATAFDKGPDGNPIFDSGLHRAEGFPFSFRFDTPGTYRYFCVVHGGDNPNNPVTSMNGEVVVVASAGAAPPTTGATAPGSGTEVQSQALPRTGGQPAGGPALGVLAALLLGVRRRVISS